MIMTTNIFSSIAKVMKKSIILLLICSAITFPVMAQQLTPSIISAGGGTDRVSALQLDWTLGEQSVETYSGHAQIYTEGFHQPVILIESILAKDEIPSSAANSEHVTVAPNPFSSGLDIGLDLDAEKTIQIQLHHIDGTLLLQQKMMIQNGYVQLELEHIAQGLYVLQVIATDGSLARTFKISKIN